MEKYDLIISRAIIPIRQSIDDASSLRNLVLPKNQSELVIPDNFQIRNKGKSPPYQPRSPGSNQEQIRIGKPVVCKRNKSRNELEFYHKKQYQIFITI
jgi:hypothetical protein